MDTPCYDIMEKIGKEVKILQETQKNKMIFNQVIKDYTKWTDNIKMEIDEEYNEDYTSQNDITSLILEYRPHDIEDIFV